MYTLKEGWIAMQGSLPVEDWDGKMYCTEVDADIVFRTNITQGYLAAYTFTLVLDGWLTIVYNGKELTLTSCDIYIYSPGMPLTIMAASDNYRAICLMADEHTTIELPSVHDLVHIAYAPIIELHEPKISLPRSEAQHMEQRMREIIGYLHSDHIYKREILRMLYAAFLLDMQNAQQHSIVKHKTPQRVEEIFIGFIRLLPLHFADTPSFSKFFLRMKGVNPRRYRTEK